MRTLLFGVPPHAQFPIDVVPNTLGVEYNAHVIESTLTYVAPALGWR